MRKEVQHRKLSAEQLEILADIFRIIPREVNTAQDRDKLAPGELGINYKQGEIWIRSPYTGKLFSPNNAERLKMLGRKIIPGTTKFNADLVHGITFYTDLIELDSINEAFTPDSVIRQMHAPAIFFGRIEYENFTGYGWPAQSGMLLCFKAYEMSVITRFYVDNSNLVYTGQYNVEKHLFEGWTNESGNPNEYQTTVGGDPNHVTTTIPGNIMDFTTIYIVTERPIYVSADINVNGTGPKPILMPNGKPLDHEIAENTSIMLIYDSVRDSWIYLDRTETAMSAILQIVLDRVASMNSSGEQNTAAVISQLKEQVASALKESEERMQNSMKALNDKHDREVSELTAGYEAKIQSLEERIAALEKHYKDNNLVIMSLKQS